jgi:RNA polymerase sigma factor (sigma-70 family)
LEKKQVSTDTFLLFVVLFIKHLILMNTNKQKISEFMQLYQPLQYRLSAYCRVVTGSDDKALDLIQETITLAFERFHTLRQPGSFQFFLIGIARNCHLKQQRRWKFFGNGSEIKPGNIEVSSDTSDTQYDIKLIHQFIALLNSEQRETILMFHIMGFSIQEIAENLAISEAAVKNRLVRGRENLRKLLSDKETLLRRNISAINLNTLPK